MAPNPFHFIWRGCCIVGEQICRSIRRPLVRGSVLPGLTGAARGLHEIHRRWISLSSSDVLHRRLRRRRPQTSLASFQGLRQPRLQDGRLQGLPQLVLAERQWQIPSLWYRHFSFCFANLIRSFVVFANSVCLICFSYMQGYPWPIYLVGSHPVVSSLEITLKMMLMHYAQLPRNLELLICSWHILQFLCITHVEKTVS